MFEIRNATMADLEQITALEQSCFPAEEAGTKEAFAYRLQAFPERFFVALEGGRIVGLVNGCASQLNRIQDALYAPWGHEPDGNNQMVFGLAVAKSHRNRGIGSTLLNCLIAFAKSQNMEQVVLTCKKEKISFYERLGFRNYGVSQSTHGGEIWYDMIREL